MKIIGICGWATSGKDTVADFVEQQLDGVLRYSMATPVKEQAKFMGWDGKKDGPGRQLLIDVGMAGRRYDRDCWLKQAERHRYVWQHRYNYMVIPDIRFENEADWVTQNGILIRVYREGVQQIDHQSEKELDDYLTRYVIQNNGTKDDLAEEVRLTLQEAQCITL